MPKQSRGIPNDYLTHKKKLAEDIGARIRERRLELNLSQKDLRERLQLQSVYVTRSQFSRIENGERLPVASEIIALAATLDITCNWLLLGSEKEHKK